MIFFIIFLREKEIRNQHLDLHHYFFSLEKKNTHGTCLIMSSLSSTVSQGWRSSLYSSISRVQELGKMLFRRCSCSSWNEKKISFITSSETQGLIVERTGNWGERRNNGVGGGGKGREEKQLFSSLPFSPHPLPFLRRSSSAPASPSPPTPPPLPHPFGLRGWFYRG